MRPTSLFLGVATSLVLLVACAAPEPTSSPVRPTPTSAPTAAGSPRPATPSSAPAPSNTAGPASAQASQAAADANAGARTFTVDPGQSEVKLTVKEVFADGNVTNDAVLTTKEIKGQIVITRDGHLVADKSKFTVALDTLKSDRGQRDQFIKRSTLQTSQFPNAEFQPTELKLNGPVPAGSGDVKGQLVGTMTVHGVGRPVTFDLEGRVDGGTAKGTARASLKITEFGMTLPRVPIVASIEDLGRLEITFVANAG